MMQFKTLGAVCALTAAFTLACSLGGKEEELEGDDAGECSDQADNDINGLFDCDDPGCAASPACEEELDGWDDSGDDTGGGFNGPTEIESTFYNCDSSTWWFDVYTLGRVGTAELQIIQTGVSRENAWVELGHGFWTTTPNAGESDTRGTHDPGGAWDHPYLELTIVDSPGEVRPGQTTLFDCISAREATLTWAVEVTDLEGSDAGCAAWGDDVYNTDFYDLAACEPI